MNWNEFIKQQIPCGTKKIFIPHGHIPHKISEQFDTS